MGLIAARYPEADGGDGFDKVADCIIREETSRVCQAFASSLSAHSHLGIWPIWRIGTESQKRQYFKPALTGQKVSCFGLSETDSGSNIHASETCLIFIDDLFLQDDALLGGQEGTYPIILESLTENRVDVSANCMSMATAAFEEAKRYAHERIISD